jgi:hypothetical protein
MAQLFPSGYNSAFRNAIVVGLVTLIALPFVCYIFYRSPYITWQHWPLEQPVPFSHKHHVGGLGIDCRYCHNAVEHHAYAGMPTSAVCMTCHSQIWTNAPILQPVRDSYTSGQPLAWRRVHKLPDYVFFNHGIHLHAGVACYTCHGRVDQMPLMEKAKPLTMQWCTTCHSHPWHFIGQREHVFDMPPPPSEKQDEFGHQLVKEYHIQVDRLVNCTTCHR